MISSTQAERPDVIDESFLRRLWADELANRPPLPTDPVEARRLYEEGQAKFDADLQRRGLRTKAEAMADARAKLTARTKGAPRLEDREEAKRLFREQKAAYDKELKRKGLAFGKLDDLVARLKA